MTTSCDVIVIGEGIAGLTCAAELAAAGLKVATFEANLPGGLATNLNEPSGFEPADGMSGMDYAVTLALANKKAGVESVTEAVTAIRPAGTGFEVAAESRMLAARFVVLASGASLKKLSVPGEAGFEGRGVSWCADCDAPLFAGAVTIVAGSGQWAVQDALLLARDCATVHLVCPARRLDATPASLAQVTATPNIQVHTATTVAHILGDDQGMTGIRVQDPAGTREIQATGLFVMTGLEANSGIAPGAATRDSDNSLVADEHCETTVSGLWAIGQVRAGFGGWLNDAVADARAAAARIQARLAS